MRLAEFLEAAGFDADRDVGVTCVLRLVKTHKFIGMLHVRNDAHCETSADAKALADARCVVVSHEYFGVAR